MHYVLGVHEVQGEQNLLHNARSLSHCESLDLLNLFEQVSARDKLHDDVEVCFILHELEDTSDVRVLCFFEDFKLVAIQLFIDRGLSKRFLGDFLDGADNIALSVFTKVN